MFNISKYIIEDKKTVVDALSKINKLGADNPLILFVINSDEKVIGTLTDGDLRRGLLANKTLSTCVKDVMKKDFHYFKNLEDYEKFNELKNLDLKIVPLLEEDNKIVDLINLSNYRAILPLDAVIMAGGRGVRIKPYTNDTPKPMLELAGKPILAHNIDRLIKYGIKNIYISVNHLKEQIIDYVKKNYSQYNIHFIEETEPLGTIGSIKLINNFKNKDILVMNADILTNIDFYDFFVNYKKFKDDMSVASFNIRINVPYGIFDTKDKKINSLIEKPSFNYFSNAGIYLLNEDVLKYIPDNMKFNSTELMESLIENSKKVSHFPIRGYWLDIGNAQNYAKAQDDIRFIKF